MATTIEIENNKRFVRSITQSRDGGTYINIPMAVKDSLRIQKQDYLEIIQRGDSIVMRRLP